MRLKSLLRSLLPELSLILLVSAPLSAQMNLPEVSEIRFRGNEVFSDAALASAIITRDTECRSFILYPACLAGADFALEPFIFSEREFRRDHARVRLFYYLRGYREAVVDTSVVRKEDQDVEITFDIQEGTPVRVMDLGFRGNVELPDSSVLDDLPIAQGEPLSMVALDATRDTLETRLKNQGFAHAVVLRSYLIPRDTPHEAQVAFEIDPGPLTRFGPVTVDISKPGGAVPSVDESVVRRMLPFGEGDRYNEALWFQGQRNLYSLDLFRFVTLTPDTTAPADSILPFTVRVEEGDVHRVRAGGGLNNAECFNLESRWSSRNFYGGARRLQVTARLSNVLTRSLKGGFPCGDAGTGEYGKLTGSISADFTQPWFFSPRNSFTSSVFLERQSLPDLFVQEALGMSFGLTHSTTPTSVVGFFYRPRLSRLDAAQVFFCSSYLICDSEEIMGLQEANWLAPVEVTFSLDRRNQVLNPTRGISALVDLENASGWTASEFRYTRIISEATWHGQTSDRWVVGARLRGGWVGPRGFQGLGGREGSSDVLHPEKRFYSGGANSVRGFGQNRLGPRVLYVEEAADLLVGDTLPGGRVACTPEQVMDRSCDAQGLPDGSYLSRPSGGTRLLEGSVEVRFPIDGRFWEAATFMDFGQVWGESEEVALGDLEFTPGFGVRYFSPIGPIRVDLAYRFGGGEPLPVVTQAIELFDPERHDERERLPSPYDGYAAPGDLVVLDPLVRWGQDLSSWDLRRFQLHFSIGQAF